MVEKVTLETNPDIGGVVRSVTLWGLVAVVAAVMGWNGMAMAQPGQGGGGRFDPKAMCQQRFDRMDTNQDGVVTKEEFMAGQEEFFRMRDSNGNNQLDKEEFCPERPPGMGMGMNPKKQ